MTRDEFIKLLEERGDAVYIVDKGLIRFGKFSLTLLAMFGLIGVFFFVECGVSLLNSGLTILPFTILQRPLHFVDIHSG
jgi:hypothetical protein